ncbi:hypothetical protein ACIQTU_15270 [Brevundimonas sp. NPDC090276]|uniref:hypothetical protein n=1 Tax=Brevundimonas sp. NPDC090276 TaxID=3363956 RepID=UPI00383B5C89
MIKRIGMLVLASAALSGCAAKTVPLDVSQVENFGQRSLVSVNQPAPVFLPMRPSTGALGMVGAAMMLSEGQTYAEAYHVKDPTPSLEADLTRRLQARYRIAAGEPMTMADTDAKAGYPVANGTLYVDARTFSWGYAYFPFNWGRYTVRYGAWMQVIDGATSKVIAQHQCLEDSHKDGSTAPTLDELLADRSALLNAELEKLALVCAAQFEAAALAA